MLGRLKTSPRVHGVLRVLIRMARRVTRKRDDHLVVSGWPDTEGNALEVIRWILNRRSEQVTWLTEKVSRAEALSLLQPCQDLSRLRIFPKRSLQGFAAFLSARVTFFTHGMYLNPPPNRGETIVNVWHGDGPKLSKASAHNRPPSCSFVVSGAERFAASKAEFLRLGADQVLLCGNPRWDQFLRPVEDHELRALEMDPTRPFLVCMLTYRSAKPVGSKLGWEDSLIAAGTAASATQHLLAGLTEGAAAVGLQLVVKPHPLDMEHYSIEGAVVLTDNELRSAGVSTYRLLARSSGLVSDYSSVWTDYLTLDRPIGFILPDLDEYKAVRGLNVEDLLHLLPGPTLATAEDCARFAANVLVDPADMKLARKRSASLIGLVRSQGATEALFHELTRRGTLT